MTGTRATEFTHHTKRGTLLGYLSLKSVPQKQYHQCIGTRGWYTSATCHWRPEVNQAGIQLLLPSLIDVTAVCMVNGYIRTYVHLLGEELDFNSWNNVFARWRLQELRDKQKHTLICSNLLYVLHLPLHIAL